MVSDSDGPLPMIISALLLSFACSMPHLRDSIAILARLLMVKPNFPMQSVVFFNNDMVISVECLRKISINGVNRQTVLHIVA